MKVIVERTPESEAVLNVEVEWPEVEAASDRAYRRLAQKYNIPGFRRGHAPRPTLERMLGKDAIYQEGLEDIVETAYRDAVRENDLRPLSQPEIDAQPFEMGQSYTFTARVPVLAPIELGDYKAIRVERPTIEITEDEVEDVVERLQQDQAMWLPAERPAQVGDKVTVDLKLTVGERQVSDLHDNEFELAIERPGIFAGMDDHLVGAKEGDTLDFTTTIPEDYSNPELAGKEASYAVALKAVKFKELPELDDEFAKTVGQFENMDAVREAIRQQLLQQKDGDARRQLRDEVLKAAADQATVTIHPVLVREEVDSMVHDTEHNLEQSRLTLEQFLEISKKTEDEFRKELEPEAEQRVKRDLVLNAIADNEQIRISENEMQNWLNALAAFGGKQMRMRQLSANQRANIAARLMRDRALTYLMDIATEGNPSPIVVSDAEAGEADEDEETPQASQASEAAAKAAAVAGEEPAIPTAAEEAEAPKAATSAQAEQPATSAKAAAKAAETVEAEADDAEVPGSGA